MKKLRLTIYQFEIQGDPITATRFDDGRFNSFHADEGHDTMTNILEQAALISSVASKVGYGPRRVTHKMKPENKTGEILIDAHKSLSKHIIELEDV